MADKKYTKTVLNKLNLADLRSTAEEEGLDTDELTTKAALIEALLEVEIDEDEIDDDEELDDEVDDTEVDDDEVDDTEDDDPELPDEEETDDVEEAPAKVTKKTKAVKADAGEGGTLAAKQVATLLNTEAKTLRQFFRSTASTVEPVGSGGRYEFAEADIPTIQKEFTAWKDGHAARGSKRTGEGSTRSRGRRGATEVVEVEEVEELEIEELEDEDLELDD